MRQYHQDELQKNINGGLISYISINVNRTIDYFSKKFRVQLLVGIVILKNNMFMKLYLRV